MPSEHPTRPEQREEHGRVLTALIEGSASRGLRIATRLIGAADAEDAVQEALARTMIDLPRVQEPEAWFIRSLVNHCIGILRRRRVWHVFSGRAEPADDASPGAEVQLAHAHEARALRRLVSDLPAMQRAVIELRYGEELTVAEIAPVLGIGDETVKTHLARALARLRTEVRR